MCIQQLIKIKNLTATNKLSMKTNISKIILTFIAACFLFLTHADAQCVGSSLQFNGINSEVDCGSNASLVMTSEFSVEAWINPAGYGSGGGGGYGGIIINKEGEYEISTWNDGSIYFALANSSPAWNWVATGVRE